MTSSRSQQEEMGHCVKQMRTSPPTQFHVWEETRCGRLQRFLKVGGYKIAKKTDQTPQKASNAKFYDGEFNDFPGFTSAQLPVTINSTCLVDSRAASAKNTNRRTYLHRIIFHGDEVRVGGHRQAAQDGLAHPASSRSVLLRSMLPVQLLDLLDVRPPRIREALELRQWKPNIRTATATKSLA